MTDIQLYNTATRRKEPFAPLDPNDVKMYVCGPTVYDRAHIGNARPVIVFDTLFRLLRHVYGAEHVTYVRNFTDIDDKINARAARDGRSIREITDETTGWYLEDMAAVGALEPTKMPRATDWIDEMVAMGAALIEKGHAYEAEGHVLFRVRSYEEYGLLSGRSVDDMIAGARVEVAPFKEDPMDFVIWKPSDEGTPGWPSPWGRGRPGWHIECSAMAFGLLGESFDIHGGGNDLTFPHHENEIAQSKCMGHGFARYWMHNEMLQVEGKKMSKSLGNFFTVRDLLDQGVSGEVIRFVFLSTHYRKPIDWTERKRQEAHRAMRSIRDNEEVSGMLEVLNRGDQKIDLPPPSSELVEALEDDLNTSLALHEFRRLAKSRPVERDAALQTISDGRILGFFDGASATNSIVAAPRDADLLRSLASDLLELRIEAMSSKDFRYVDKAKLELADAGVEVLISKDGVELRPGPDFDPSKLEALK